MPETENGTTLRRSAAPDPDSTSTDRSDGWAEVEFPQAVAFRRSRVSIVWLIPLVALLAGGWLAYKTLSEQGPRISIEFTTAAGIQAGKTKVKFKDVDVGEVTAIDVSPDLKHVVVTAQLKHGSGHYLTKKTQFWVERPRVSASRVSGLETLLSGPYIAVDPVAEGDAARTFVGLEEPPLFTTAEPGKRLQLLSPTLGSLNIGSPVYYRQIQVGQVIGHELDADGQAVNIGIFISAPHDRLVSSDTRFWNASGVDFSLSPSGLKVDTQSLLSVLIGGVSFDTPDTIDGERKSALANDVFPLYRSQNEAHEKTYAHKERYLLFFQGSVNGLAVGAQVLLRGIVIGRVLAIQLTFNEESLTFQIPVLIEVEPERIGVRGDRRELDHADVVERLVAKGLRGQLKAGSLLTGQLYVDLDFHPNAPPERIERHGDYGVLPTVPAPLEALTTRATSILDKIDAMPIEQIGKDVGQAVASANAIISSKALTGAIAETQAALAAVRQTADRVNVEIAPELSAALRETTATAKYAGEIVSENSPLYIEMQRMFQEFTATARSLRGLADYLERHPEALLKGKAGGR
ncbi:MAG TPA: MlaD family protein [Lamprocystis sp. (in: g-proteobacteria)]|nr:MlaD family protein [Lamprocystis sp. (in: g-proteobacteria)]